MKPVVRPCRAADLRTLLPLAAMLALAAIATCARAADAPKPSAAVPASAKPDPAPNQWPEITQKIVRAVRVYDGADGVPRAEDIELPVWQAMPAENVRIATLPPNEKIGRHAPTKRHLIIPLKGVTWMILGKARIESRPGMIILVEDTKGEGHSGEIGPEGYVGIDVTLRD